MFLGTRRILPADKSWHGIRLVGTNVEDCRGIGGGPGPLDGDNFSLFLRWLQTLLRALIATLLKTPMPLRSPEDPSKEISWGLATPQWADGRRRITHQDSPLETASVSSEPSSSPGIRQWPELSRQAAPG